MLPGGGCMHLVDSLGRHPGLSFVCTLHEQGAAVAADAYSQYTGNLGVALVTTGPGGTNALTGVAAAWLDSTACLFLSGQVKRADLTKTRGVRQMGFQEIDIVAMAKPITKYAVTVEEPTRIRYHLEKALHLARCGRPGPVWVDLPLDVQATQVEPGELPGFDPAELPVPVYPGLEADAEQAVELLLGSERPVLLAGNGIRLAKALPEFHRLIERLRIPVLTTWKAADFLPEDHSLFAGRPGASGQRGANFTQQNSDWFLSLGARLDHGQIAYMPEYFARGARKIFVDMDPSELAKLGPIADVSVAADAGDFLRVLLRKLEGVRLPDFSPWRERTQAWKHRYPVCLPEYRTASGPVNNYALVDALSNLLGEGDLLVPGSSGACSEITHQAWRVRPGLRILNSQGLGPMGFGPPAALGACVASGGKRTVCLDGDGGFQMNLQELETIRRLDLPIKFFVLDNQGYGSIRSSQNAHFGGRLVASDASSGLTLPDTEAVARGYGVRTARLDDNQELAGPRLRELLDAPGPLVCVVRISPEQATAPRAVSFQRADGSMATKPMEDLFPFLDREEFRSNMSSPEF
jgi:acetolactate synthase-1/2/3 large subunit